MQKKSVAKASSWSSSSSPLLERGLGKFETIARITKNSNTTPIALLRLAIVLKEQDIDELSLMHYSNDHLFNLTSIWESSIAKFWS